MMILTEKLSFAFGKKINLMRTRSLLLQRKKRLDRMNHVYFLFHCRGENKRGRKRSRKDISAEFACLDVLTVLLLIVGS